jgi:hypothetical protein
VTASFRPLRDQDVRSRVYGDPRLSDILDLAEEPRSSRLDPRSELARIAKGQHHSAGAMAERDIEQVRLLLQAPRDEAASDPRVSCRCELLVEPVEVPIAAADEAETARASNGGCELSARHEVHGREQDRICDPEQRANTSLKPHARTSSSVTT